MQNIWLVSKVILSLCQQIKGGGNSVNTAKNKMKQSAATIAANNIEICKSMTAAEISAKFADVFANTLSRSNFVKVLYKNGIDFNKMEYMENSIEFTIVDKYSNSASTTKRLHNRELNERDINNKFYPFCTEVYLSKKEIHIVPCQYHLGMHQTTPNVKIIN